MPDLKRILLVEDNPYDLELTLTAMANMRLLNDVVVVRDGAEALDYLCKRGIYTLRADGNPAIILLDLKLPKIDGIEVLTQIRNSPELKMVPVVMLTSSREEKDLIRSYAGGVNGYVVKPVDFNEFVEALKQVGMFWAVVNQPPPHTSV
jgi:CheY-like chemotaxis protein